MAMGNGINAMFYDHPEIYDQLFDVPHAGPGSAERPRPIKRTSDSLMKNRVRAAGEGFADFFELTLDLMDSIPPERQEDWKQYMRTCLRNSQYLRDLIRETEWRGKDLKELSAKAQDEIDREAATSAQQEHKFQHARRLVQPILNILHKR